MFYIIVCRNDTRMNEKGSLKNSKKTRIKGYRGKKGARKMSGNRDKIISQLQTAAVTLHALQVSFSGLIRLDGGFKCKMKSVTSCLRAFLKHWIR